jgi:hypothetical protein
MSERWVVEGEWSGYTSSQQRVVHRAVVSAKTAQAIKDLGSIRFTDGTRLDLSVRRCAPRERVTCINGYGALIADCLSLGVTSVSEIGPAREKRRAARLGGTS